MPALSHCHPALQLACHTLSCANDSGHADSHDSTRRSAAHTPHLCTSAVPTLKVLQALLCVQARSRVHSLDAGLACKRGVHAELRLGRLASPLLRLCTCACLQVTTKRTSARQGMACVATPAGPGPRSAVPASLRVTPAIFPSLCTASSKLHVFSAQAAGSERSTWEGGLRQARARAPRALPVLRGAGPLEALLQHGRHGGAPWGADQGQIVVDALHVPLQLLAHQVHLLRSPAASTQAAEPCAGCAAQDAQGAYALHGARRACSGCLQAPCTAQNCAQLGRKQPTSPSSSPWGPPQSKSARSAWRPAARRTSCSSGLHTPGAAPAPAAGRLLGHALVLWRGAGRRAWILRCACSPTVPSLAEGWCWLCRRSCTQGLHGRSGPGADGSLAPAALSGIPGPVPLACASSTKLLQALQILGGCGIGTYLHCLSSIARVGWHRSASVSPACLGSCVQDRMCVRVDPGFRVPHLLALPLHGSVLRLGVARRGQAQAAAAHGLLHALPVVGQAQGVVARVRLHTRRLRRPLLRPLACRAVVPGWLRWGQRCLPAVHKQPASQNLRRPALPVSVASLCGGLR